MSWKKTDTILNAQLNSRGMAPIIIGTQLCQESERLYPGQFKAVSIRKNILHLHVSHAQLMAFKLIEGKLLQDVNRFATTQKLPLINKIKLTISDDFGNL
jgi:hypothetical protein